MIAGIMLLSAAIFIFAISYLIQKIFNVNKIGLIITIIILSEFAKKLLYIVSYGQVGKSGSFIIGLPLFLVFILTVLNFKGILEDFRSSKFLKKMYTCLFSMYSIILLFSVINISSIDTQQLYSYASVFYLPIILRLIIKEGFGRNEIRLISFFLITSMFIGAYNTYVGTDFIWRSFTYYAEELVISARYTGDRGYSGSIFSSPAEYASFSIAMSSILCMYLIHSGKSKYLSLIIAVNIVNGVVSGTRYFLVASIIFSILILFRSYIHRGSRPINVISAIFITLFLQDYAIKSLTAEANLARDIEDVNYRRLTTTGTLNDRAGFNEALVNLSKQHAVIGTGFALTSDDRHNFTLKTLINGGILSIIAYYLFLYYCLVLTYVSNKLAKTTRYYLVGVYVYVFMFMGMGGPQPITSWTYLGLAIIIGMCLSGD